ncbi:hypothetical protein PQX77_021356 [Marasmius sp. AFHP31]|nr:hypothetical protein PQX77_021356 [Marasmius sp. AFHP31]
MRLDPLQDFLYLAPQTDESTFRDILNAQIGPYAQAIAEIGVLSVSTALIPGALRAWVDAVFNAIPVLTPREAVPVRMFFFNPAGAIERMTRPYTSPPSEAASSPNMSGLELSPYDASINFKLYKVYTGFEKYAHSIMQVGFLSTVMAQLPEYFKAWGNEVFLEAVEEPFIPFTGRHHFFNVLD